MRIVHEHVAGKIVAQSKVRTAPLSGWSEEYRRRTGLEPAGPEALQIAQDALYAELADQATEEVFTAKVVEYFERSLDKFRGYQVQIARVSSGALFIGDVPVSSCKPRYGRSRCAPWGCARRCARRLYADRSGSAGLLRQGVRAKGTDSSEINTVNGWQARTFVRWLAASTAPAAEEGASAVRSRDRRQRVRDAER